MPIYLKQPTIQTYTRDKFLHQLFGSSPRRTNQVFEIEVYRKPTSTDTIIHYNSNHPTQHNLEAYRSILHSMYQLPLSPPYKQKEWHTATRAKAHALSQRPFYETQCTDITKLTLSPKKTPLSTITTPQTWVAFTYYNPMVRKLTNLFRSTNPKSHSVRTINSYYFT
jgi:hypothetical protein